MSRKNGNGRIHKNVLIPSTVDEISLCQSVEENFITLCNIHKRQLGMELIPPKSLDKDFVRWRQLAVRYRSGDFRHSEEEYESVKTIAQWTIDINCRIRNQPQKKVNWK